MEWKDIESAPRDGTRILLFNDAEVYVGRWFDLWATWGVNVKSTDGNWQSFANIGEEKWGDRVLNAGPSHFMPLPPPPAIGENDE